MKQKKLTSKQLTKLANDATAYAKRVNTANAHAVAAKRHKAVADLICDWLTKTGRQYSARMGHHADWESYHTEKAVQLLTGKKLNEVHERFEKAKSSVYRPPRQVYIPVAYD